MRAPLTKYLKVTEILFANPALFSDANYTLPGERASDLAERRPRALVRRHVEVDAVVIGGAGEQWAEAGPARPTLVDSVGRQGDLVIGRGGVGAGVEVPFRLAVSDQDDPFRQQVPLVAVALLVVVLQHCRENYDACLLLFFTWFCLISRNERIRFALQLVL